MAHPPVYEGPPPFTPRPAAVAAVVWIQCVTAVVLVVSAVGFLVVKGTVRGEAERLMHHDITGDFEIASGEIAWAIEGSFTQAAVFHVVLAAVFAVLAALNAQGAGAARVLTFVMSGVVLGCCLPVGVFTRTNDDFFAHRSLLPQDSGGAEYSNEANEWITAATPQWVTALDWISVLLMAGGALAFLSLLNVPAAKRYFRDQRTG
ncbi:hypothetical protein [Glycomyces sp. NPDC048151]|uniref:hypothetical protein n=1 Tax=Glycomyces sp. NPDC048151 TaxID=3364002 RepID=UPI003723E875